MTRERKGVSLPKKKYIRLKKTESVTLNGKKENDRKDTRKKTRKNYPDPEVYSYIGKGIAYSINPKCETIRENRYTPGPGNRNPINLFKLMNVKFGKFGKGSRDNSQSIYAGAFGNTKEIRA